MPMVVQGPGAGPDVTHAVPAFERQRLDGPSHPAGSYQGYLHSKRFFFLMVNGEL